MRNNTSSQYLLLIGQNKIVTQENNNILDKIFVSLFIVF